MTFSSNSLKSFKGYRREQYTDYEWEIHIENILSNMVHPDEMGEVEYAGIYNWVHERKDFKKYDPTWLYCDPAPWAVVEAKGRIEKNISNSVKKRSADTEIIVDSKKKKNYSCIE